MEHNIKLLSGGVPTGFRALFSFSHLDAGRSLTAAAELFQESFQIMTSVS